MSQLEELQPNAAVRGILPDALVTVVSVQWFGSEALELTYKTPAGKVANELLYRHDEPRLEVVEQGRPWSFDGDGALFRLVSEAQRIRLAHLFDPVLAVHTSHRRAAAAPDHGGLRGHAAAPAAALPAGRRSRRRQDHHGRPAHQGADRPRRPAALPRRLPGQPRRAVAGRALPPLPSALRDPHQRQARGRAHRQLVPGDQPGHRPPRQALAQRGRAAEAPGAGLPLGSRRLRRGAQDVGHGLRRRDQVHQALPARPAPLDPHAALPADDGDAAQRQGRGLPALHGAARRRPLRGPLPRRRPRGRRLGPDAPDGEGEPAQVRRHAALPRAHRLHRALQALGRRSPALQGGHRLRARGVQPRRGAGERQARRHRRLCADHPAAAAGLLARGDLPVAAPPPRAAGKPAARAGSCSSAAARPRHRSRRRCPRSTPRTSRTWRTRPTTRSRPPRRRSSTRPPRPAPSPS